MEADVKGNGVPEQKKGKMKRGKTREQMQKVSGEKRDRNSRYSEIYIQQTWYST